MTTPNKKQVSILSVLVPAILLLFLLSIWLFSPGSAAEVEYNWYKEQGYIIYKINYGDFLDCLLPTPMKEIMVSKEWLRENAYINKIEYGEILLAYCPDRDFICLATYDAELDVAYILIWKPG